MDGDVDQPACRDELLGHEPVVRRRCRVARRMGGCRTPEGSSPCCHPTLTAPISRQGYPKELKTLGDHLEARRLDMGLYQKQVAALTGVDPATIRRLEADQPQTAKRPARAVCRLLGLEIV
jgi:DNA-binding XRE family transcriptional regulator